MSHLLDGVTCLASDGSESWDDDMSLLVHLRVNGEALSEFQGHAGVVEHDEYSPNVV